MPDLLDISTWVRQAFSPILDGNNPNNVRGGGSAQFFGYNEVSTTSISIPSIWQAVTSNESPMALCVSARDVTAVGSRLLSANAYSPYRFIEYRWTITNNDDSPVEDLEGITDPRDDSSVNPYTDQISPEGTFILRDPGTYKIKLTARGMSSTANEVIEETFTDTVTVVEPTINHVWIDGSGGDDANDGLDPWGLELSTAAYTESTGELTQVGGFTPYVHDVSVNFTDRDNYIFLVGFGLRRIDSKLSNDTVVLAQKLGSDQANLVSSDGPKQTFNGTVSQNNRYHLNGGSSYTITSNMDFNNYTDDIGIFAYNGTARLVADGVISYISDSFYNTTDTMPPNQIFSNIEFDGDDSAGTLSVANQNATDSDLAMVMIDRCTSVKNDTAAGVLIQASYDYPKPVHIILNDLEIDNRYLSGGKAASGIGLFTVNGNGAVTRAIGLNIKNDADDDGAEHYWYPSGDLSNFHAAYCDFNLGSGSNYGINFTVHNLAGNAVASYLSVNNCNFGPGMNWGYDNTGSSPASQEFFEEFVAVNNKCNAINALSFNYSMRTSYQAYNQDFGNSVFFGSYALSNSVSHTYTNFDGVVLGCESYGRLFADYNEGGNRELVSNAAHATFDSTILNYSPAALIGANVFAAKNNNLYAPNKTSSTIILEDGGAVTLAAWNAGSSDITGNTSTDPSWPDGPNGDFGGLPTGILVEIQ
jgi:hypothetical protein